MLHHAMSTSLTGSQSAMQPAEPDLRIRGLRKAFQGVQVLGGVDLEVRKGEAVALIGANGAGKSTLLRCCLLLVEPDAGELDVLGHDFRALRGRRLREVRSRIGFVFQRHNLCPRLSVLTNVLHGAMGRAPGVRTWRQSLARQGDREEAMQCLDMVGLAHLAARRADGLSGGQSQRVAIARALMQRPKLMMADEPVASLDPCAGEEVMEVFFRLIREAGLTLVYTSHNLGQALAYSDRLVGLRNGRIELDAASASLDESALRGIYDN